MLRGQCTKVKTKSGPRTSTPSPYQLNALTLSVPCVHSKSNGEGSARHSPVRPSKIYTRLSCAAR